MGAVAVLSVILTACAGGAEGGGEDTRATSVVYVPGLTGNPFYSTVSCGAATQAKEDGVDFTTQGAPEFDVTSQTKILNAVIASQPSAIMISITDPDALSVPLQAAKDAGIKIIGIDGDLNDKSIMETNIQSDGFAGGKLAGEALAKSVNFKGEVIAIANDSGSLVAKARTDGFKAAIDEHPEMKFLGVQYSKNEVSKAANIASTTSTTNPNLVGILTAETNNTEGVITGLREAGQTGKIRVFGYDVSDPIQKALEDRVLDGTVVQDPAGAGKLGVRSAVAAVKGDKVERNISTGAVLATPDNLATKEVQDHLYDVNCKAGK